jgi:predicted alpha/beta-fold hydrolase
LIWDYQPPWWLPGGNAQTIYSAKLAQRYVGAKPRWQRERWDTPDGDFVDVDWRSDDIELPDDAPLLVLFHGLEGSSSSHYAQAFAQEAKLRTWLCRISEDAVVNSIGLHVRTTRVILKKWAGCSAALKCSIRAPYLPSVFL